MDITAAEVSISPHCVQEGVLGRCGLHRSNPTIRLSSTPTVCRYAAAGGLRRCILGVIALKALDAHQELDLPDCSDYDSAINWRAAAPGGSHPSVPRGMMSSHVLV